MEKNKYLTHSSIMSIYTRLKNETDISELPILGKNIEFGLGEICLFETNNIFVFYIINQTNKEYIKIFDNIKDAVNYLVNVYDYYKFIDDPTKMKDIFYEELNINKTLTKKR